MRSVQAFLSVPRHLLLLVAAGIPVLVLAGGLIATTTSSAAASQGQILPQIVTQTSFEAMGLPAGAATGTAARATLPPGLNFRHAHGGPEYVYVISGAFTVI